MSFFWRIFGEYLFAFGSGKKGGLGESPQLPHYAGGSSGRNPIWQGLSYGAQASRDGRACGKRARAGDARSTPATRL